MFSKPHGWVGSSVRQFILRRLLWEIRYGAHEEARTVGRQEVPASATPLKKGIRNRIGFPLRPCLGQGASLGEEAVLADSGRAGEVAAGVGRVRSLDFLSIL
jgi:hypothetical protein